MRSPTGNVKGIPDCKATVQVDVSALIGLGYRWSQLKRFCFQESLRRLFEGMEMSKKEGTLRYF